MPAPFSTVDPAVRRLSWATLGFTVAVILGGAVVRATDSGAGCGDSWPRCEGHIIPVSASGATLVEFTHRAMTFILGALLIAMVVMVFRRHAKGEPLRRALGWSVGFFFGEVLIGAALVLFGWVEDDASIARVFAVTVHLVNTFLLLGALTVTAHLASGGGVPDLAADRGRSRTVLVGVAVLLIVSASGALNALADTLGEGAAPWLLYELRIFHPLIAIAGGGALFFLSQGRAFADDDLSGGKVARLRRGVQVIIAIQFAAGFLNIALLTPVETQVLHLLLADVLWILWVRLGAEALSTPTTPTAVAEQRAVAA
jgi:heme A synthase